MHTQGPWRVGEVRHNYDCIIRAAKGDSICSTYWAGYTAKEAKSNAALIAAAPDLLAACEFAREAIPKEFLYQTGQFCRPAQNYPPQGTTHGDIHEALKLIVAAIAKAKGGV